MWDDQRNLRDLQDTIIYDDHKDVCRSGRKIRNMVISNNKFYQFLTFLLNRY